MNQRPHLWYSVDHQANPNGDSISGSAFSVYLGSTDGYISWVKYKDDPSQSYWIGEGRASYGVELAMRQDGSVVPLPGTLLLLASGLLGMAGLSRFRKKR